jgi:hypothetical protein
LESILDSKVYKEALKSFLTNNGGIEKFNMINDIQEFSKSSPDVLKANSASVYAKHKNALSSESQKSIEASLSKLLILNAAYESYRQSNATNV